MAVNLSDYDFGGYATRNDLKCADGRTIRKNAFKDCDGAIVPIVYQHDHNDPENVLGHGLLENREDGVYVYGKFNNTPKGQHAKESVRNRDIRSLSIYANQLQQQNGDVFHGVIREVSLVLAGANPGAVIDFPILAHSGEEIYTEAIITTGEENLSLMHEDQQAGTKKTNDDKTIGDVFNELTDEQKNVVYFIVAQALEDAGVTDENEEGNNSMKHNVFDPDEQIYGDFLSHAEMAAIIEDAKKSGSLRDAYNRALDNGTISHAVDTTGMTVATGTQTYGFNDPEMLFPDYRTLSNTPEFIQRDMDWVQKVMGSVHHTPFSRIKSVFANITEDEARAKGYLKAHQKKTEVFSTLKRTTDPQTVYKLQKLDRDDVIDITDFDVIAWIRGEMRLMLNEELARAMLIGDGRLADAEDKISESHIRPIATDVALFNTKVKVSKSSSDDDAAIAKKTINAAIKARKNYKGSGNPTFFTTEDVLTDMLLLEDGIGHKLYKTEAELATALRVKEIVTVEPMENQKVDGLDLIGIIVNPVDYNVGADKGGEINMFDDFDINFNRYEYLIETRISGALTRPYSALTLLLDSGSSSDDSEDEDEDETSGN